MSKSDPWMPFYPGDYLRDTTRLSTEQHGAYLLLILDYWTSGPPPDNDRTLAHITRLDARRWKLCRKVLEPFFSTVSGKWTHKRIEAELERSRSFREKQQANGRLGGRPRKTQNESQNKPNCYPRPKPKLKPKESLPQPHSSEANASAPDPGKTLFDEGVALLVGKGRAEASARAVIAKFQRDFGDPAVLDAINRCRNATDPVSAMRDRLGKVKAQAEYYGP